ncbi:MAG: alkaline phosphatase family protein [Ferruginibacter sp.]|nr:alkaline phosphatase family protein [Ferruginibacter sp.]
MRLKFYIPFVIFLVSVYCVPAQKKTGMGNTNQQPKLVVGLVIDQMRWDYLYRFNSLYGNDGFKRLLRGGFSFENTMIPYTPTYTAPGHSCIYTGSVPALNGIIGNFWYDKRTGKSVYCVDDSTALPVGSNSNAGKMSPGNLWTTTITDELRLSNNFRSRVFGISLKDRGAILPAGHSANAAYWFDASVGKWISSTHYMKALPGYVDGFNDKDLAGDYMKGEWNTLLPIENYEQSTADDKPYENPIPGLHTVTFPHKLSLITSDKYEAFKYTPFASTYTFDFAKTVLENEQLGNKAVTDFLAISISSTDYAGHHFGPNSVEIEDIYLRLDKDIAGFLQYLDDKLGKGNYLLFLSADHAVAHIPGFLQEHEIPSAVFSNIEIKNELNKMVEKKYGIPRVIPSVQNYQVYVDKNALRLNGKNEEAVLTDIIQLLAGKEFITDVVETSKINAASISQPQRERMINGYNAQRSGDIQFTVKAGYFDGANKGTTHGSWNPYDAHIPLLFYGWNIKPGKTNREVYMTDIAPTIAAMLQIQMPSGCVGKVLDEVSGK